MQISPLDPRNSPLTPEQAAWLNQVVQTLSPQQAVWLGGYFTGMGGMGQSMQALLGPGGAVAPGAPALHVGPATAASAAPQVLTILFGSQTGNGEKVAKKALAAAQAKGLNAVIKNMGNVKTNQFKNDQNLMVIVSTHGEGDAPDTVAELHEFLHGARAPKVPELAFTVLALGDKTYEHYCKVGKDFDAVLEKLGGKRIADRVDCDVDYAANAGAWITRAVDAFAAKFAAAAPAASAAPAPAAPYGFTFPTAGLAAAPVVAEPTHTRENPFAAALLENLVLNGRGSSKETRHIELSLAGSGITYEPGDSLGVLPTNWPQLVDDLIVAAGLDADGQVTAHDGAMSLRDGLIHLYDIKNVTSDFVAEYNRFAESSELAALLEPANRKGFMEYIYGREVIDIVQAFPVKGLTAPVFTAMLRKLQPRLYSIASYLDAHPEEVHLCIATVRYHSFDRERKGVASSHFAERLKAGSTVDVYVHDNSNFRMPTDSATPMIMIGPGTGVAPFRAFVEQRDQAGATGKNWLFFGDQHFTTDFLYQTEWLDFHKRGVLNRLDVAFSRDQKEKLYVQHRMLEKSRELYAWLQDGAAVYVCGDASRMAQDVHNALLGIVAKEGGKTPEQAAEFVKQLQKDKRYQRDVY